MARIEKELLKRIHSGKCVILVGSSASLDAGYLSWRQMVTYLLDNNKLLFNDDEIINLQKKIDEDTNSLLSVLDALELKIGKQELVNQVKKQFETVSNNYSLIQSIITRWPVPYYLTTNYDSELKKYLQKIDEIFLERNNTEKDFLKLSTTSEKEIFKIHGDFNNYETMIITKKDYNEIRTSPKYDYWRKKMQSILMVSDILLIGYSANDPDFQDQLEIAKKYSNPNKPIFMFATGLSNKEITDLRSYKNIQVIPYESNGGDHSVLGRLLTNYDRFIPKRNSPLINREEQKLIESEIASSLFIFNDTFFNNNKIIAKALYNRILNILNETKRISIHDLVIKLRDKNIYSEEKSVLEAINDLSDFRYIQKTSLDELLITDKGIQLLSVAERDFSDYKKRFFEFCNNELEKKGLNEIDREKIISYINSGLVILFKKRGIEIAKKVISDDDEAELSGTLDIADCFSEIEKDLTSTQYDYYIDLLFSILERPSKESRDYLAILCNGYFIYHILGHNENARNQRLDFIKRNKIYLDSSILIPLLAKSCQNNKYAEDLISMIRELNQNLYITHNLLREVVDHADWAIRKFKNKNVSDFDLYTQEIEVGNTKENLFIMGGINWLSKNGYTNFSSYFEEIFGDDFTVDIEEKILEKLSLFGIKIHDKDNFLEFIDKHYVSYEKYKARIKKEREEHKTYRSELQCETEAELLVIADIEPINFLTHTTNLKKFNTVNTISHWFPEGIYRFIQMNNVSLDLDDLFNCMITGLYTNGIKSINKEDIERITKPYIHQAELKLKEMKSAGNVEIQKYLENNIIEHEKENLTLPFYQSQVAYLLDESLKKQKEYMEIQTRRLEEEKKSNTLTTAQKNEYYYLKEKKRIKQQKEQNKRNRNNRNKKRKRK